MAVEIINGPMKKALSSIGIYIKYFQKKDANFSQALSGSRG